jgi:hypothetical protein
LLGGKLLKDTTASASKEWLHPFIFLEHSKNPLNSRNSTYLLTSQEKWCLKQPENQNT